eukprot:TRINITY_DN65441_c0_g2_i1.p1 TRINITY_DN65441_c0_g2~~TRINITY_DN65441_c0_g2_i1.p1  ORF type:complete len:322 (+),score=61.66 TRINITY_DN65441_c0_g2_i1:103-1068(+)
MSMGTHVLDEPCRWALGQQLGKASEDEAKLGDTMIDLPEAEQVARGQTLLQLLGQGPCEREESGAGAARPDVPMQLRQAAAPALHAETHCMLSTRPISRESFPVDRIDLSVPHIPPPPMWRAPPPPKSLRRSGAAAQLNRRRAAAEAATAAAALAVPPFEPPAGFEPPAARLLHDQNFGNRGGRQEFLELAGLVQGCVNDDVGSEADRSSVSEDTASTASTFRAGSVKGSNASSGLPQKLRAPQHCWYMGPAAPGPLGPGNLSYMGNPMSHAAAMSAMAAGQLGVRPEAMPPGASFMPLGPMGHLTNSATSMHGMRSSAVR